MNPRMKFWNEIFRKRCQCYIVTDSNGHCQERQIFKRKLNNVPLFIRFDCVEIDYQIAVKALPISVKCQSAVNYLQSLKLNDSSLILFNGTIDKNNRSHFSDHSQLIDHLQNELLPVCGSSHRYKFEICFFTDKVSHTNLIALILQIPQIECCPNVEIKLPVSTIHGMQFPIEPISNWLHRNYDGIKGKSQERFLRIYSFSFVCVQELCDHLRKAKFICFK